MHRFLTLALVCGALVSCGGEPTDNNAGDAQWPTDVVRIKVMLAGTIDCDDEIVTLDELATILKDAATKKHTVWYYREAANGEPSPIVLQVVRLVGENQLPIQFFTGPDFAEPMVFNR